ncbi:hypothetical protein ACF1FX_33695 [Streptomyces sp. NPDC014646]|uniref:hypothetical protein n=1 Tax=Streptomyces sp. NPDC014646 TaxID=3364877 RepID=UPI0036FE1FDB
MSESVEQPDLVRVKGSQRHIDQEAIVREARLSDIDEFIVGIGAWTEAAIPYLVAAVLIGVVAWAYWINRRARIVRSALADRASVELVPTSTFDPSEGEVGRWARQLGRVRYAAQGVPPRGSAVRLRYSAEDGKMRCFVEGPATAAAVLAMPGFAEVEVRAHRAQDCIHPVRFAAPDEGAQ